MALNITKEVANMERLSVGALCKRYREVFDEDTKARNKQWLIKRIAWKLQANEEGDISERARKLAMEIAHRPTFERRLQRYEHDQLKRPSRPPPPSSLRQRIADCLLPAPC